MAVFFSFFSPGVYRVGSGVSVPKLLTSSRPVHTEAARAARIEGTVELLAVIGEDGAPRDIQVQKGLGFDLDEKAIECAARRRFSPGVLQRNPVPVAATIRVNFRLEPAAHDAGSPPGVHASSLESAAPTTPGTRWRAPWAGRLCRRRPSRTPASRSPRR